MSIKYYILGWLRASPAHGYELKKRYREFIGPDQKLNDAKLYPLLSELEREGLVEKRLVDAGTGPARKVVHITDKGREEFTRWLESQDDEGYEDRPPYDFFRAFPFLTKFPFFGDLDPAFILGKLRTQREIHAKRLEGYEAARQKMVAKGLSATKIRALDFGIRLEAAKLAWLEEMIDVYGGERSV